MRKEDLKGDWGEAPCLSSLDSNFPKCPPPASPGTLQVERIVTATNTLHELTETPGQDRPRVEGKNPKVGGGSLSLGTLHPQKCILNTLLLSRPLLTLAKKLLWSRRLLARLGGGGEGKHVVTSQPPRVRTREI